MKARKVIILLKIAIIIGVRSLCTVAADSTTCDGNSDNDATCSSNAENTPIAVHEHYEILEILPHDVDAFTQGLTYDPVHNILWEGTGLEGSSQLRQVDPKTGDVIKKVSLESKYFGEGISFYKDKDGHRRFIIQISWKDKTGWIYDAETMELSKTFNYETSTGEGWGITYNPNRHEFYVSDGSQYIMVWDATTLQEIRRFTVVHPQTSTQIPHLNELEFSPSDNTLLANVWYKDAILKIDVDTGRITQIYDFTKLYPHRKKGEDCFNGISITEKPNEFWVTGKLWPSMYRVKVLL